MTFQIDPVRFEAFLVDAGTELPLTEPRRDEVLAAFDVALERLFVIYDERQARSRVELVIANASIALQRALKAMTLQVIGAIALMVVLAFIVAKLT
jgi:hypothetical protein